MKTDEHSPGTADAQFGVEPVPTHSFYRALVATLLSNIGSWMQNAAAGWLMTSLRPQPFEVALVQAATTLPMFLFGLPAGALADIIDRRTRRSTDADGILACIWRHAPWRPIPSARSVHPIANRRRPLG